ncbi:MAG: Spy/CpxP family protein refolding chaperone [Planctomycetota bacterium]
MKRSLTGIAIALFLVPAVLFAEGQRRPDVRGEGRPRDREDRPDGMARPGEGRPGDMNRDDIVERIRDQVREISEKLALSEDQKAQVREKVKAIIDAEKDAADGSIKELMEKARAAMEAGDHEQARQLREQAETALKAKMDGLRDKVRAAIRSVLTAEQQAKFDAHVAEMDSRRDEMRENREERRDEMQDRRQERIQRFKEHIAVLKEKLGLTDAQVEQIKEKVKAIIEAEKEDADGSIKAMMEEAREAMKAGDKAKADALREKIEAALKAKGDALREQIHAAIASVLTDEQKAKFDAAKERMGDGCGERREERQQLRDGNRGQGGEGCSDCGGKAKGEVMRKGDGKGRR